ncbi:MAG: multicopper oxidase domain-containing protein [Roseiflexaceae bacterium]|nr:multicopper oxidase domain-containing protein [Roseiflexaceae bacterium]
MKAGIRRIMALGLIATLALVACSQNPATPPPPPTVQAVQQVSVPTGPVIKILEFDAIDMGFTPNNVNADVPGRYTIKLKNNGSVLHDMTFTDGTKITAKSGETQQADVMIGEGGVKFICSLPGHKESGMVGTIAVAGKAVAGEGNSGGDHGGPPIALDVQPDPNASAYQTYDPIAPKLLEGTVHDITLETIEKPMTVAKGFVQHVWTFNGTVPGPVLRVKVGDTVRIHLKNNPSSKLPHSVDFHSSMVAWNDEMTSINPGEEKLYEFKAEYAGVWMYHCGTSPALHHIANGMYGMMIVEPKEGLPVVDKEFVLVQSEWYIGPQGEPVSLSKAAAAAPAPDYVVFNGIANQYKDTPIQIDTGKRVRVFVLNAGPSIDSSFHIVGTIFDSVIKEGVHLTVDNVGHYGSQAVDLSPAQGAIVEFSMAEDGLYPIVTHAFNFPGRGALGLFKAGDGDPKK